MKKVVKIKPTGEYPCQWDDLIDDKGKTIATIYTEEEAKKDGLKTGIRKGRDGVYDIVVWAREINNEVVRNALKDLGKKTGTNYVLCVRRTIEDDIIAWAEKLMKPLEKYGNPKRGYDFSKASTPRQKAEIISIWVGEILYEALTYKDERVVKSLAETVKAEIQDLVCQ